MKNGLPLCEGKYIVVIFLLSYQSFQTNSGVQGVLNVNYFRLSMNNEILVALLSKKEFVLKVHNLGYSSVHSTIS